MTTLAELRNDSTDVQDGSGNVVARIEWTEDAMTGACEPIIMWEEHLKFHMERLNPDQSLGDTETLPRRVEDALKDMLPSDDFLVHVSWSDADDQDGYPFLTVEIFPVLNSDWTEDSDTVEGLLWPAIAMMLNVTDPGTYGSPYLFSGLITER